MSNLREQLNRVRADRGRLTPESVVEAATPEDHPLHSRFEWNDSVAGHEYRKVQAAELIRSVRVTYAETRDGEPKSVRAFVAVRGEAASSTYEPIGEVVEDEFARRLLLQQCRREVAALERKYGHLQEFAEIMGRQIA